MYFKSSSYLFSLFVWGFSSHLRIHSHGEVTITGEGVQILTYAQHSWPLSSEGSLACHTYYDTGQPFIMVISEETWHSHLLPSFWQWSCHYLFLRLRSTVAGIRKPNFRLRGERSNRLSHRLGNLPFRSHLFKISRSESYRSRDGPKKLYTQYLLEFNSLL